MAEAVLRLAQQPIVARRLGRQARLDAETRSWPVVLDGLLAVYEGLVSRSAKAPGLMVGAPPSLSEVSPLAAHDRGVHTA